MAQNLYLAMVLAAFATFMVTLGGVSIWQRLGARREEAKREKAPVKAAEPRLAPHAVSRPY